MGLHRAPLPGRGGRYRQPMNPLAIAAMLQPALS